MTTDICISRRKARTSRKKILQPGLEKWKFWALEYDRNGAQGLLVTLGFTPVLFPQSCPPFFGFGCFFDGALWCFGSAPTGRAIDRKGTTLLAPIDTISLRFGVYSLCLISTGLSLPKKKKEKNTKILLQLYLLHSTNQDPPPPLPQHAPCSCSYSYVAKDDYLVE